MSFTEKQDNTIPEPQKTRAKDERAKLTFVEINDEETCFVLLHIMSLL